MQTAESPTPFVSGAEALSTQTVGKAHRPLFLARTQKIGLNLSEDLFFWSSPNFGRKIVLN